MWTPKNVLINTSSPQPRILKRVYIHVMINIYYNSLYVTAHTSIDCASKPKEKKRSCAIDDFNVIASSSALYHLFIICPSIIV